MATITATPYSHVLDVLGNLARTSGSRLSFYHTPNSQREADIYKVDIKLCTNNLIIDLNVMVKRGTSAEKCRFAFKGGVTFRNSSYPHITCTGANFTKKEATDKINELLNDVYNTLTLPEITELSNILDRNFPIDLHAFSKHIYDISKLYPYVTSGVSRLASGRIEAFIQSGLHNVGPIVAFMVDEVTGNCISSNSNLNGMRDALEGRSLGSIDDYIAKVVGEHKKRLKAQLVGQ